MAFTFYLMKLPWLAGDEKFLIWSTSAVKFSFRDVPDSEAFAFINTSYDLQLIDRFDEFGFPVGNQVITNREKLALLLSAINSGDKKPKYVMIDVHFVDSTDSDLMLKEELEKMDNVILSAHLNEQHTLEKPIFNEINFGLSDYVIGSVFDGVYKYQLLYNDSMKLTPLKVHQSISGEEVKPFGPFVKIGNRWTTNNFIMNYRILQKDIQDLEAGFNPVSLGELLYLTDEDIQDFVADKIVIIGDFFENDMHETIFEITSGPLILLNAYLNIQSSETRINLFFLLIIIGTYSYLSYMAFAASDPIERRIKKIYKGKLSKYLLGFTSYLIILSLLSIATFFLFNIHINVFFIALAFYLIDRMTHWVTPKKTVEEYR